MRTREALSALTEGRLASPAGRSELVELATRLIVEEALEGEVRDAIIHPKDAPHPEFPATLGLHRDQGQGEPRVKEAQRT
jgi:hypothetical protein